jgi:hypothetical protein
LERKAVSTVSTEHAANRQLDPADLLEFKRSVFSKYYAEWHGHLGHKWRHEDTVSVIMGLMERLDECPPPDVDPEYCACVECYENYVYDWCLGVLDDICWSRAVYRANTNMPLGQAMKLKPRRKNCKPMQYEQHGNILYIKMSLPDSEEFLVWTVEDEWKDWVDAIWPVYLKHDYRLGWYIAKSTKRQLRDGSWLPCDVSVAHLFCLCLHGESVRPADGSMLNYIDGNLIRVDNVEKDTTDPDKPPRAFQLAVDVSGLDQWRPPKKTNTTHEDTADETEEGRLQGNVSAGAAAASWKLDRVVDGKEATQVAPAPTVRGIDRKVRNLAEQESLSDTTMRTSKVERVKTKEATQDVKDKMNAIWAAGTSHLDAASGQT